MRRQSILAALLAVVSILPAAGQAPPVTGVCVSGCPGQAPTGGDRDRPEPRPHSPPPNPKQIEQQAFDDRMREYQVIVDRLNGFLSTIRGSRFDPSVRDSVLTIFGENSVALAAGPAVRSSVSFSMPGLVGADIAGLERDVRELMVSLPGLQSAALYRSDLSGLAARSAGVADQLRRLTALDGELRQWLAEHPGPSGEAEYRQRVAELARRIDQLQQENASMFQKARSLAGAARADADKVLKQLDLAVPETLGRDGPEIRSAEGFAKGVVPVRAEAANWSTMDFRRGWSEMPDWTMVAGAVAPWYSQYWQHFSGNVVVAFADPVPEPPGPTKATAQRLSGGEARARIEPELRTLSRNLDELSDAVGKYNDTHSRYAAAVVQYRQTAESIKERAKPAFQALHLQALKVFEDEQLRGRAKTAWLTIYESVRAVAWENFARRLAAVPGVLETREEAMKRAVLLIPAVQDLAKGEFEEIMKGPEVIAHGDPAMAAELDAKVQQHVCEFVHGPTPALTNLPTFLGPYMTSKSCD